VLTVKVLLRSPGRASLENQYKIFCQNAPLNHHRELLSKKSNDLTTKNPVHKNKMGRTDAPHLAEKLTPTP
jgi:hypothetical protein